MTSSGLKHDREMRRKARQAEKAARRARRRGQPAPLNGHTGATLPEPPPAPEPPPEPPAAPERPPYRNPELRRLVEYRLRQYGR
jgi:hypothetical protein